MHANNPPTQRGLENQQTYSAKTPAVSQDQGYRKLAGTEKPGEFYY